MHLIGCLATATPHNVKWCLSGGDKNSSQRDPPSHTFVLLIHWLADVASCIRGGLKASLTKDKNTSWETNICWLLEVQWETILVCVQATWQTRPRPIPTLHMRGTLISQLYVQLSCENLCFLNPCTNVSIQFKSNYVGDGQLTRWQ